MFPSLSVIVDQIHVNDFTVLKTKHDTPVSRYAHAPLTSLISLQGVKPEARSGRTARIRRFL